MELHSYAKHNRAIKKWSVEQKRRLVEARINCDEVFRLKPKTSLVPWNKVIFQAKLDDFNAVFVRKQWANMVAKYMQYKQDRLGNKPTHDIDADTVLKITKEWEFFQPIHRYMTCKTTNLHSYALMTQNQNQEKFEYTQQQSPKQASTSSNERLNACSSDTNEDFVNEIPSDILPNTDHDFYSKKSEHQCYFADVEEDTLESTTMDIETVSATVVNSIDIQHTQEFEVNGTQVYETKPNVLNVANQEIVQTDIIKQEPEESNNNDNSNVAAMPKPNRTKSDASSSERDRYYRHKRRFNHRMECRFDAILNIIGQIAKTHYPNIDMSPLQEAAGCFTNGFVSTSSYSSSDEETNGDKNAARHS